MIPLSHVRVGAERSANVDILSVPKQLHGKECCHLLVCTRCLQGSASELTPECAEQIPIFSAFFDLKVEFFSVRPFSTVDCEISEEKYQRSIEGSTGGMFTEAFL